MKTTSILTAAVLFSALLISSCGSTAADTAGQSADTDVITVAETSVSSGTEETKLMPDLPETDFGGASVRFLSREITDPTIRYYSEVAATETNGETMNDATYERTMRIQDTYNVVIVNDTTSDPISTFRKSFTAGEDNWDVVISGFSSVISLAKDGTYFWDFNELPYVNLSQPWWDTQVAEDLTIAGHVYAAIGSMNTWTDSHTYAIVFNKDLAVSYDIDPYKMVDENTWTLDNYTSIVKSITSDVNGDSIIDQNDLWGACGSNDSFSMYMTGCGISTVTHDESGYPVYQITDRFYDAASKIATLMDKNYYMIAENYTKVDSDPWANVMRPAFRSGNVLFYAGGIEQMIIFRDLETPIGLLPVPKYDESSDYAHTFSTYWSSIMAVPNSTPSTEMTGLILEAMNADSYYGTSESYYEVLLKGKAMRDEESVRMLEIIRQTRTMDWEYAFSYLNLSSIYQNILSKGSASELSSQIAKSLPKAETKLAKLLEES